MDAISKKRGSPIRRDATEAVEWKSFSSWLDAYCWTIPRIGEELNVTRHTVYRWVNTSVSPDMKMLKKICLTTCRGDTRKASEMLFDVWQDGILSYDAEAIRLILSVVCPKRDSAIDLIHRVFFMRQK